MNLPEFKGFDPIRRLYRDCVVTEKIDGTNALIYISEDKEVIAGSKSRWLVGCDNFGFAAWVEQNKEELKRLGPGHHYGEWWGSGIQRGYGLKEKRFSLFNTGRWGEGGKSADCVPRCCSVVPVLYKGPFDTLDIKNVLNILEKTGSQAAPGFMKPEGIVVFHEHSQTLFKATIGDDGHKGVKS